MIDQITKKVIPEPRSQMYAGSPIQPRASSKKKSLENPPPKRFRAEDNIFTPGIFDFDARPENTKLNRIANTMNKMAAEVAGNDSKMRN
jgi:hypothetical protein